MQTKSKTDAVQVIGVFAEDINGAIGLKGSKDLCWHCPEDLKAFKALTMGHTVVMGRSTFEAIGTKLPGRNIVVLSRTKVGDNVIGRAEELFTLDECYFEKGKVFIVGGADTYEAFKHMVDVWHVTMLGSELKCTDGSIVYAPKIDSSCFDLQSSSEMLWSVDGVITPCKSLVLVRKEVKS